MSHHCLKKSSSLPAALGLVFGIHLWKIAISCGSVIELPPYVRWISCVAELKLALPRIWRRAMYARPDRV